MEQLFYGLFVALKGLNGKTVTEQDLQPIIGRLANLQTKVRKFDDVSLLIEHINYVNQLGQLPPKLQEAQTKMQGKLAQKLLTIHNGE